MSSLLEKEKGPLNTEQACNEIVRWFGWKLDSRDLSMLLSIVRRIR